MSKKRAAAEFDQCNAGTLAPIQEFYGSEFDKKTLQHKGNGYRASNGSGDPMKTLHIAPNGGELSLIRCYRDNLHESLSYQWVQARLVPAGLSITVRENDITKEMRYQFSWRLAEPLSDEKVALFVQLYKVVAKQLDPNQIEICGRSCGHGPVDYGRLEISAKQELLEACKQHFSAAETKELSRFIETQRDGEGVMTFRVTNLYTIEESV